MREVREYKNTNNAYIMNDLEEPKEILHDDYVDRNDVFIRDFKGIHSSKERNKDKNRIK